MNCPHGDIPELCCDVGKDRRGNWVCVKCGDIVTMKEEQRISSCSCTSKKV